MKAIRWAVVLLVFAALTGSLSTRSSSGQSSPAASSSESPFTLVAIGDSGLLTQDLFDNAMGVTEVIRAAKAGQRALHFLGDNFYTYGLSRDPINVRERRYRVLYDDLFGDAMATLVKDGCPKESSGAGDSCPAGPVNYVHAVA